MKDIKTINKKKVFVNYLIKILILLIFLFPVLWSSCARKGSLTGGKKDTVPPVMIGSNPAEKTTGFKGKKVKIVFDEYFQLNDLNSVFLSSPPLEEKPKFKIKKRSLVIKFKEELLDTSTYTLSFGNAIEDYHESNPIKNFKFVFSTDTVVDSLSVGGQIIDAFTGEAGKEMYVMLYNHYKDSTPLLEKPYFIARTDTSGFFTIDYIKPGKYRVFALKDVDDNLLFNLPNEEIAYTDTLIIPEVEEKITTDSLKAGTIIHYPNDTLRVDTLRYDSVAITRENFYSPNNIILLKFTEDRDMQYITQNSRPIDGKCVFEYNKYPDSLLIKSLDPQVNINDIIIEKSDTAKIVNYWLKDSAIYNIDTLKFEVSYYNKDSLQNLIVETDTFNFIKEIEEEIIKDKKKEELRDTIPEIKYVDVNFKEEEEHFFFNDYYFDTKHPINKYDPSKIKLYEIVDTLVLDPKKQELINYQRQNPSKLFFAFTRPIVKDFNLRVLNLKTEREWYTVNFNKNKDSVICTITDSLAYQKDTLKLIVHYDNDFFLKQIQQIEDTTIMPLTEQKILSIERKFEDTLKINYNLPLLDIPKLNVLDTEYKNWYKTIPTSNKKAQLIKITEPKVALIDTLTLGLKALYYKTEQGEDKYFTDTTFAVYVFKKQLLKSAQRPKRDKLSFIFNKALHKSIKLKPLNFTYKNWFEKTIVKTGDTVNIKITNGSVVRLDTIKLEVSYEIVTRDKKNETKIDTVNLFVRKQEIVPMTRDNKKRISSDEKQEVQIDVKVLFEFIKDSTKVRTYKVSYPWKGDKSYKLKIDSTAFTDIFDYYNKRAEKVFSVKGKDYFGTLKLSLSNVKKISEKDFYTDVFIPDSTKFTDSVKIDSVIVDSLPNNVSKKDSIENSILPNGKIILQLFDNEDKLVKRVKITKDSILIFDSLAPGEYRLKLIYDKNNNDKWDTGEYLKNVKPERTLTYKGMITVKSKWENQTDWIIRFER